MKWLWVTPRWPIPDFDGARIATSRLLSGLSQNARVDLCVWAAVPAQEARDAIDLSSRFPGIRQSQVEIRSGPILGSRMLGHGWRALTSPTQAMTLTPFSTTRLRDSLLRTIERNRPDVVIFDGIHAAAVLGNEKELVALSKKTPLVYRAHNVETDLWIGSADQAKQIQRVFLLDQAKKIERFEQSVVRTCALTAAVSEDDEREFRIRMSPKRTAVVRIGMDFPEQPPMKTSFPNHTVLGFVGKMDWAPNREGLLWFLREIWPKIHAKRPDLLLRLAGQGTQNLPLTEMQCVGIESLGFVANLDSFYSSIDGLIVPILVGSGTRVKAIEASRYATACIGTPLGLAGCGFQDGRSAIIPGGEHAWLQSLLNLEKSSLHEMGKQAWADSRERFDSVKNAEILVQALDEFDGT